MYDEHLPLEGGTAHVHQLDGVLGHILVRLLKSGELRHRTVGNHGVPRQDLVHLALREADAGQKIHGAGFGHAGDE